MSNRFFSWQKRAHWDEVCVSRCEDEVASLLATRFAGTLAFHACRPASVREYLALGIRGHEPDFLRARAHQVFGARFERAAIDVAFTEVQPGRPGMVYLAVDERTLTDDASHYVTYGSEQLNGVAAHLDREDFGVARRLLASTGTPTIFACGLPWGRLNGDLAHDFMRQLAREIVELGADARDATEGWTCCVSGIVSREMIQSHRHVRRAPDVFRNYEVHELAGARCDVCGFRPGREGGPLSRFGPVVGVVDSLRLQSVVGGDNGAAMAATKKASPAMEFLLESLKADKKAAYADLAAGAEKKGLKVFPIMFGRAQAMLGIVKSAKRGEGRAAKAKAPKKQVEHAARSGRPAGGGATKSERIREMLKSGMSASDIAKSIGCTTALVYNVKSRGGTPAVAAKRTPVSSSSIGLAAIVESVRASEAERVRLRAAIERIQALVASVL